MREHPQTSSNLEERKAGENLEILDPASLPEQASEPNRLLIAGIGIGLGLFFGVLMAGVKEMKDTSLKNLKDVRAYTNLPVLEQHSAARECAAGAAQAPPVLAGLVDRHHCRHHRHERFDVLLLFREDIESGGCRGAPEGAPVPSPGDEMSRVHDALRRAEQAGVVNLEGGTAR